MVRGGRGGPVHAAICRILELPGVLHCAIADAHVLPSGALDRKHVEGERQNINTEQERCSKAGPDTA